MNTKNFISMAIITLILISGCSKPPEVESEDTATESTTASAVPKALDEPKMPEAPVSDFTFELRKTEGTYAITGYTGNMTEFTLPSKYDDTDITAIWKEAFMGNTDIIGVTIPQSIISVGVSAFENCATLEEVIMPGKDKDTTVIFEEIEDEEILSDVMMKSNVFSGCTGLSHITLPDGLLSVPANSFIGCANLRKIKIPSSVSEIGNSAFSDCVSLESISIPPSVNLIGYWAFSNCTKLTDIKITESTVIMYPNFDGSPFKKNQLDSTGSFIVNNVLYEHEKQVRVVIPEGVKEIYGNGAYGGSGVFRYDNTIQSVTFPSSLEVIGSYAFADCPGLTEINYLDLTNLKKICRFAFSESYDAVIWKKDDDISNLIMKVCESEDDYLILTGQYNNHSDNNMNSNPPSNEVPMYTNPFIGTWKQYEFGGIEIWSWQFRGDGYMYPSAWGIPADLHTYSWTSDILTIENLNTGKISHIPFKIVNGNTLVMELPSPNEDDEDGITPIALYKVE
jgi:hypothetical protein